MYMRWITKVENKTADQVGVAIVNQHKPYGGKVKMLTFDNGKEFCGDVKIDEPLGSTSYFARPFDSWKRGKFEYFNILLR